MVLRIEEFLEKCNKKIGEYKYELAWWSFSNNFERIKFGISFDEFEEKDFSKFIKICDNRLERAKTFLNDIAVVLGFDFIALSIIATIAKEHETIWSLIINPDYLILTFLIVFLFAILIFLFVLMFHYRSQVHAWTAFKEMALIKCPLGKNSRTKEEEQNT